MTDDDVPSNCLCDGCARCGSGASTGRWYAGDCLRLATRGDLCAWCALERRRKRGEALLVVLAALAALAFAVTVGAWDAAWFGGAP